jgi:radical SAM superfamily enzyme YgiQ (UPF0313 family)
MNILFIYSVQKSLLIKKPLKAQEDIQMGIAQLSAVLKQAGHETDLLVLDRKYKKQNTALIDNKLRANCYGLVCFTSVFSEFNFITDVARYVKSTSNVFTILGGTHVTISPEESYLDIFDALCIGEGEDALLKLANKLDKKDDISSIPNLWLKQNGLIVKNETSDFIQDLDSLPFVDRDLWQPYIFDTRTRLTVLVGRGCPYNCTYCCNHRIRKVAGGKYVRMRSPKNIIAELDSLSAKFPVVTEYFLEIETLGANLNWLVQLCDEIYLFNKNRERKLTFGANLRVYDNLDVELVFSNLKKANFESVIIGLESGSERVRTQVLNRQYQNATIIKAVNCARRHGIKIGVFNLVGLPTETLADFNETLKMNQLIQPDWHATSIFFPYKGTRLYDMAEELGLLPRELNFKEERQHATLDLPGFSREQVQQQFDSFHYNVYKVRTDKSPIKTILFLIQKIFGHNFMANVKNKVIVILASLNIKNNLMKIIQK